MTNLQKLLVNSLCIAVLLVLPDFLFSLCNSSFKMSHDIKSLALIFPLGFGLAFNKYRWFSGLVIGLLALLQLMQFSHLAYFGTSLSPYSLQLFSMEVADVFEEAVASYKDYLYLVPLVGIPFLFIFLLCSKIKVRKSFIGALVIVAVFGTIGGRLFIVNAPRFTPNEIRITLDNSLKAFFGFWIINLRNYEIKKYKSYTIIEKEFDPELPMNIVYIIGESVNYNHMSLFGYERATTPRLNELSKSADFYYTKAISGAIATFSSSKFLLNVIGEPDNVVQTALDVTNLFRLAKQRGFKTFYISTQTDHLLSSIGGVKYIDFISTKNSALMQVNELMDEHLFQVIDSQTFSDKNFIVLHQRCIHAPYATTFSKNFKQRETFKGSSNPLIDQYDNALIYNDFLISTLFDRFNKQKKGKFYIIWTSDHNELLGENGLFGHGHGMLVPETANVPLLLQTNDPVFMEEIKAIFKPTHYEIAKQIAKILGYEIQNPNEEKDYLYVDGIDYNGKCGFMKLRKEAKE